MTSAAGGTAPGEQVTALIVAGGKASRLGGVDKRELVVDGRTIFERQVAALAPCVAEIVVSSRRPVPGYRRVVDEVDDAGPLAGIAAGLAATQTAWLFVVAGDMPHLDRRFVEFVLSHCDAGSDAVGIRIGGLPEPLCSALRVAAWRPIVAARLAARRFRVSSLLTDEALRIRWIDEAELRAIDPQLRSLHNVNTPQDL
jgi:molybdopterin-guanine dinucleotide biosynthesis protein A